MPHFVYPNAGRINNHPSESIVFLGCGKLTASSNHLGYRIFPVSKSVSDAISLLLKNQERLPILYEKPDYAPGCENVSFNGDSSYLATLLSIIDSNNQRKKFIRSDIWATGYIENNYPDVILNAVEQPYFNKKLEGFLNSDSLLFIVPFTNINLIDDATRCMIEESDTIVRNLNDFNMLDNFEQKIILWVKISELDVLIDALFEKSRYEWLKLIIKTQWFKLSLTVFAAFILILISTLINYPHKNALIPYISPSQVFPIGKGNTGKDQSVIFNGDLANSDVAQFGGKVLELHISGSEQCKFTDGKMFKLEANNQALYPIEKERKHPNDSDYVTVGNGKVSFNLPSPLEKLQFVFWKAELNGLKISDEKSVLNIELFPIRGWSSWGGVSVSEDVINQGVTLSGNFTSTAGWVTEGDFSFSGKVLKLNISNSQNCELDHQKLFKFEVNDKPLTPIEKERINQNDREYINTDDGTVSFSLPSPVKKMQFVFWNATLKDLKISGILTDSANDPVLKPDFQIKWTGEAMYKKFRIYHNGLILDNYNKDVGNGDTIRLGNELRGKKCEIKTWHDDGTPNREEIWVYIEN